MKKVIFIIISIVLVVGGALFYLLTYTKTNNDGVMSAMKTLAIISYIYSTEHPTFTGFCRSFEVLGVHDELNAHGSLPWALELYQGNIISYTCNDSSKHWAAAVLMQNGGYVCLDDSLSYNTGKAILVAKSLSAETSCTSLPSYQTGQ